MRKPFQGVGNIIRFNWHFFAMVLVIAVLGIAFAFQLPLLPAMVVIAGVVGALAATLASLMVSWYVYDASDLYSLSWLDDLDLPDAATVVTINAGLDEISETLRDRLPGSDLHIWDFYDETKHTEVSIKRARKAYPPVAGTKSIDTDALPLGDDAADLVVLFMAAHEIRDSGERERFFSELHRILKRNGKVIVTEHLRDMPNFLAYTVGFLHFHSKATWLAAFDSAALTIENEAKENLFVATFVTSKGMHR